MRLVHGKTGRLLADGVLHTNSDGDAVLFAGGREWSPLESLDEGLVLIEATDSERQDLIESGYSLPAEVVQLRESGDQDGD